MSIENVFRITIGIVVVMFCLMCYGIDTGTQVCLTTDLGIVLESHYTIGAFNSPGITKIKTEKSTLSVLGAISYMNDEHVILEVYRNGYMGIRIGKRKYTVE